MAHSRVGSNVDTTQQWIHADLEIRVREIPSPITRVRAVVVFHRAYQGKVKLAGRIINVLSHGEGDFHGDYSVLELHLGGRSRFENRISLLLVQLLPFSYGEVGYKGMSLRVALWGAVTFEDGDHGVGIDGLSSVSGG